MAIAFAGDKFKVIKINRFIKIFNEDFRFFAVYRSTTSGFTSLNLADTLGTVVDTTFIDTTVVPGVTYFYRISAFDFSGNESVLSGEVEANRRHVPPGWDGRR